MTTDDAAGGALLAARAACVNDLAARALDTPTNVDRLDDVLERRRWWVSQWPEGAVHVAGQVAQDLQAALLEAGVRWPLCGECTADDDEPPHELRIEPELGPDPHWVCEASGTRSVDLGALRRLP